MSCIISGLKGDLDKKKKKTTKNTTKTKYLITCHASTIY